jgi:trehalose 6-phosphate phosphatase
MRPGVAGWRPVIEEARDQLLAGVPDGVRVEDKRYGVTVHWRSIPLSGGELEASAARAKELAAAVAAEHGLVARPGKSSVELALPLGIDKGTVVRELCGGLERAGFLGDDAGDLLAFHALDELRSEAGLRTLKVAVAGAEAPPALLAEADLVFDGPAGAADFLEQLAARVRPR